MNFYNEIDEYAAQWLRNLIAAGHLPPGVVDTRSIEDITPNELRQYTQCHFFAGIGVWSLALRRAGWPDDRPVWTGSCPCQPFSTAGKGQGFADERHLWPAWEHLISECRPPDVFGEQVASKDVDPWIDLVQDDLEALDYAVGAVAFPSAGVGAPHIRDRTYWVATHRTRRVLVPVGGVEGLAYDTQRRWREERADAGGRLVGDSAQGIAAGLVHDGSAGRLGHAERIGAGRDTGTSSGAQGGLVVRSVGDDAGSPSAAGGLADTERSEPSELARQWNRPGAAHSPGPASGLAGRSALLEARPAGPTNGPWAAADWLRCRDGKWRPVEPGTFPLAHGAPARVGRLRAYGNAINVEAARVFVEAVMEIT